MNYAKILLNFHTENFEFAKYLSERFEVMTLQKFCIFERFLRKSAKKSVALANSELLLDNRPNHSGLVDLQSQCVT